MEQIYHFEGARPPVLTEAILQAEQERRQNRRISLLITLSAAFVMVCVGLFASLIAGTAPVAAAILYAYIGAAFLGGGTFLINYARKGGAMI